MPWHGKRRLAEQVVICQALHLKPERLFHAELIHCKLGLLLKVCEAEGGFAGLVVYYLYG
jgi:hypothetical protein